MLSNQIRILLLAIAAFLLWGCGGIGNSFKIKGKIAGMNSAELYLFSPYGLTDRVDTIRLNDGEFEYEGEAEGPMTYVLVFPNAIEHVIFVEPGSKVSYKAASNALSKYVVEGTDDNVLMGEFRKSIEGLKDDKVKDVVIDFVEKHAESAVAIYVFDKYVIQNRGVKHSDVVRGFEYLKNKQPESAYVLTSGQLIKNRRTLAIGEKVPDVSITDTKKKNYKLWSRSSDYTLIVAWASWMRNEYDYLWKLRSVADKNKDELRVVTFSLDNELFRWQEMVKPDSLRIEHSIDVKSWNSEVIRKLGIPTVPYYIITDKAHKILFNGETIEQMEKDINKIIKK